MIVIADLHLGLKHKNTPMIDVGGGKISTHTYATLCRLEMVCKYAKSRNIGDIAILGDIFHSPYPDAVTFTHLCWLVHNHNLMFNILPGNHDCDGKHRSTVTLSMALGGVVIEEVMDRDKRFIFYPHTGYGDSFHTEKWKSEDKKNRCLMGHGQLEGVKVNDFELESTGSAMLLTSDVAKQFKTVFLGHVHKPSRIRQKKSGIDVIYPGSLFPCTFGEIGDNKGFWDLANDAFIGFDTLPFDPLVVNPLHLRGVVVPEVFMGEVTIKDSKARVNWGLRRPLPTSTNPPLMIVKVKEYSEDRASFDSDRTRRIMDRFSDKGFIVSSYERVVTGKGKEIRSLESIKGEVNHEKIFEEYVEKNYGDHSYKRVIKAAGKKMIGSVLNGP